MKMQNISGVVDDNSDDILLLIINNLVWILSPEILHA